MKYDNFKKLSYTWNVHTDCDEVNKQANYQWQVSESFSWPNCDKISFTIHLVDWCKDGFCGSSINIQKKGILDPRRTVITIKSGLFQDTEVMEDWTEEFSTTFKTDKRRTPLRKMEIYCEIRIDSLDFYDKNAFVACMGTRPYNYLFSRKLSDVIIKVEDEELPAHKIILAMSSPVFERMLKSPMVEARQNCITLREVDIFSVKQLLMFIYSGKIEKDDDVDMLIKLLACADLYQVADLKKFCEYQLIQNFRVDNIDKILVETHHLDLPLLEKKGKIYVDSNQMLILLCKMAINAFF